MVLHLDDGVRYPLFAHLVSDDAFDTSVNLRETAARMKPEGVRFSIWTDGAAD